MLEFTQTPKKTYDRDMQFLHLLYPVHPQTAIRVEIHSLSTYKVSGSHN
jgi:hypothetical protein